MYIIIYYACTFWTSGGATGGSVYVYTYMSSYKSRNLVVTTRENWFSKKKKKENTLHPVRLLALHRLACVCVGKNSIGLIHTHKNTSRAYSETASVHLRARAPNKDTFPPISSLLIALLCQRLLSYTRTPYPLFSIGTPLGLSLAIRPPDLHTRL